MKFTFTFTRVNLKYHIQELSAPNNKYSTCRPQATHNTRVNPACTGRRPTDGLAMCQPFLKPFSIPLAYHKKLIILSPRFSVKAERQSAEGRHHRLTIELSQAPSHAAPLGPHNPHQLFSRNLKYWEIRRILQSHYSPQARRVRQVHRSKECGRQ